MPKHENVWGQAGAAIPHVSPRSRDFWRCDMPDRLNLARGRSLVACVSVRNTDREFWPSRGRAYLKPSERPTISLGRLSVKVISGSSYWPLVEFVRTAASNAAAIIFREPATAKSICHVDALGKAYIGLLYSVNAALRRIVDRAASGDLIDPEGLVDGLRVWLSAAADQTSRHLSPISLRCANPSNSLRRSANSLSECRWSCRGLLKGWQRRAVSRMLPGFCRSLSAAKISG